MKRGEEERKEGDDNLERAEDGAMGSRGSHVKGVGDIDDKMVALRAPFRVAVSLVAGDSSPPPASTVVVASPSGTTGVAQFNCERAEMPSSCLFFLAEHCSELLKKAKTLLRTSAAKTPRQLCRLVKFSARDD